ncbi:hypothetical protein CH75_06355 [Dyella jiangningensis]|nr:hypothetical protein CH75_06355 [Dyella jiangningensis]
MSRARNIKPGFFKNDLLAECHPLARILFAGLWCEADREGRLEDRPKRLKAECLPYDDCDVDVLLADLAKRGFIQRYEADGVAYIAIVEFLKHQNPHVREMPSVIPAPPNAKHNLGTAKAQPRQCSELDEHGTGPALSPSPHSSSPSQTPPASARASTSTPEDGQLPHEIDPERWASYRDQLADDGKLSISRIKTAMLQLHKVVKAGHDGNAVLTAAVMRGLRDLEDTANRLAKEGSQPNAARAGPTQGHGKTVTAVLALEEVKRGLDNSGTGYGPTAADLPRLGASASR